MIRETTDPDEINAIINHPEVFPHVSQGALWPLDVEPLMDGNNIFIMADGGGFAFIYMEPGVYEGHYYFLPEFRGKYAITAAKECLNWLAKREITLIGRTPLKNKSARLFNKLIGMKRVGISDDVEIWTWQSGQQSPELSELLAEHF